MLAFPEPHDRCFIRGVDAEMKSANSLDGDDFARGQAIDASRDRIVGGNRGAIRGDESKLRAAIPARIWLRMEAPIGGILIFRLASSAHRKLRHRSLRPVVGYSPRNREARAAIGAIQKWIAIAPVVAIEQFAQAIRAGGGIGGNAGGDAAADFAGNDAETGIAVRLDLADGHRVNARQCGRFGAETEEKRFDAVVRALDLDDDSIGVVADESGQAFLKREAVNEGAEADALHHTAHPRFSSPMRRLARFWFWSRFVQWDRTSHRRPA